ASDTFFGCIFGRAEGGSDFLKAFSLKESEHNSIVIFLSKLLHRISQQWSDLRPGIWFRFIQDGLHIGFLFPSMPPAWNGQCIGAGITSRAAKPAAQNDLRVERFGLSRENNKHHLRYVFRQVRVMH